MVTSATLDRKPAVRRAGSDGELDFEGLIFIGCGHTASQLLWAGCEFDLFSLLDRDGPRTREELAAELKIDAQPARILLDGLAAMKVLCKDGERYANSVAAARHLVRGKPECMIATFGWQHHIVYPGLLDFIESLKANRNVGLRRFPGAGETLYQRLANDPATERIFQDAMSGLSAQANRVLAQVADLKDTRHLVDLGGGDGSNLLALTGRFAHLRGTVFDGATVLEAARGKIAAAGRAERIGTRTGDFLVDPLPADADAFLLAHICTIWSPERNTALFRKCCAALPAGGKLLVFNMVTDDGGAGPLMCALGSPYFQAVASGEGMLYSAGEIEGWLLEAGFSRTMRQKLPMEHVLIEAVK